MIARVTSMAAAGFHPTARLWSLGLLGLCLASLPGRLIGQPLVALGTNYVAQGHTTQMPLSLIGASNLAGLQVDVLLDSNLLQSNGVSATAAAPGVLVDGGVVASNRIRVVILSTNGNPLAEGLIATLRLVIHDDAPNGWRRVPLRNQPAVVGVTLSASGVCASTLTYQPGELYVGDAFGFVPQGGRAQFRATDGLSYVIVAISDLSSNLADWTPIGTNLGADGLVFSIDTDVTNYARRFYQARLP